MARLLLLMATHTYRAGAFLEAATRLGLEVTVGSEQKHALAELNPAGYLHLNFQDLEEATDAIIEHARRHPIEAAVAVEDDGVVLAAMASDALGLRHNPVGAVAAARNKYRMREVLREAGLNSPWFRRYRLDADPETIASEVPYPCVLKPLSLAASRGVIRANTPAEFRKAFLRIARLLQQPEIQAQEGYQAQFILIESYIPGEEYAVEGIMIEGRFQPLAVFDKPDPLIGPYFQETIYVTPARLPDAGRNALQDTTAHAVAALGLREGPIHAELRLNERGVWPLEVAPRSIGGYCSRALHFERGITLEELILRQALGQSIEHIRREAAASGVMMIPIPETGILETVAGVEEARLTPGIDELLLTAPAGQWVSPPPEGNQYLGFIFARGDTPDKVERALRTAHACLEIRVRPSSWAGQSSAESARS